MRSTLCLFVRPWIGAFAALSVLSSISALAADRINGQVLGAGVPIVWVMNNWQTIDNCFGDPDEALSSLCGGQGVTIFFGMAKPVRAPQIGPVRQPNKLEITETS